MEEADKGWLMTTIGVSGWTFLLVPAHPGCPRQNPKSRKTVVCMTLLRCCISTHLTFQVSQGSAATDLRWGENFNKFLFNSSFLNIAVKKLRKSVNIYQSYRKNKSGTFFMDHGVYVVDWGWLMVLLISDVQTACIFLRGACCDCLMNSRAHVDTFVSSLSICWLYRWAEVQLKYIRYHSFQCLNVCWHWCLTFGLSSP